MAPGTTLIIASDSAVAISNQLKVNAKNLTDRDFLKITNHYQHRINQHATMDFKVPPTYRKVKAHQTNSDIDSYYNNLADKVAKQATTLPKQQYPLLPLHIASLPSETYLHQDQKLITQYPPTFFKKQLQTRHHDAFETRIKLKWGENEAFNFPQIKKLITYRQHHNTYLHTTERRQLKFRQNITTERLPTKNRLYQWKLPDVKDTLCPLCHTEPETDRHLWECNFTKEQYPILISRTQALITERYYPIQNHQLIQPTLNLIKLNRRDICQFMKSPLARGIILDQHCQQTLQLAQLHYVKNNGNIILLQILDCWLSAFYEIIWKTRCTTWNDQLELQHAMEN